MRLLPTDWRESLSGLTSDTPRLLRAALLLIAAGSAGGLALELAAHRHWNTTIRLIPWFVIGVTLAAIVLVAYRPSFWRIWLARLLAAAVMGSAGFGIYEHVVSNYHAGPLDLRYYLRWESMSEAERWWAAVSKSVGPSPPIAPASLALGGVMILLATVRHPAAARERVPAEAIYRGASPAGR